MPQVVCELGADIRRLPHRDSVESFAALHAFLRKHTDAEELGEPVWLTPAAVSLPSPLTVLGLARIMPELQRRSAHERLRLRVPFVCRFLPGGPPSQLELLIHAGERMFLSGRMRFAQGQIDDDLVRLLDDLQLLLTSRPDPWLETAPDEPLSQIAFERRTWRFSPAADERRLLDAILADPAEDQPRLIYADWLTDHGRREGELVALECEDARLALHEPWIDRRVLRRRIDELGRGLPDTSRAWEPGFSVTRARGFASCLHATPAQLVAHAATLGEELPFLDTLVLAGPDDPAQLAAILAAPWFRRIQTLSVPDPSLLEHVDRLGAVRDLTLRAEALAPGRKLPAGLEGLTVEHSNDDEQMIEHLLALVPPTLRRLSFRFRHLAEPELRAIATWPGARRLEQLRIERSHITPEGIAQLVASPQLAERLTVLELDSVPLGHVQLGAVLGRFQLRALRLLGLVAANRDGYATDDALVTLANAPALANVALLRLQNQCRDDSPGALALKNSPYLRRVEIRYVKG